MIKAPISVIIGTRPEAIKLAPVIWELRRETSEGSVRTVITGQHDAMLMSSLSDLRIKPDVNLRALRPRQALPRLAARLTSVLALEYTRRPPALVVVQGDTLSAFAAALSAFLMRIPVAHVEAGLRTGYLDEPFPEEGSRQLIARLADLHFAPTRVAARALEREGIPASRIHLTGNTVVDALLWMARRARRPVHGKQDGPRILLTAHRRENFGLRLERIFAAVVELLRRFPRLNVVYPVHPNPNVQAPARRWFANNQRVQLIEPLSYRRLVEILQGVDLVLTDSGGLQEEAPVFGKPVLVLREETERPEAIEAGTARLVGTSPDTIVKAAEELLRDPAAYRRMARAASPFGDGIAAVRIVRIIQEFLNVGPRRFPNRSHHSARLRQLHARRGTSPLPSVGSH